MYNILVFKRQKREYVFNKFFYAYGRILFTSKIFLCNIKFDQHTRDFISGGFTDQLKKIFFDFILR
jgi:hypothetical protein